MNYYREIMHRTFQSMTLQLEVEGRWPWRRGDDVHATTSQG